LGKKEVYEALKEKNYNLESEPKTEEPKEEPVEEPEKEDSD